jgi:heme exporter protein D
VTTNHHIKVDVDHADLKGATDPGTTVRVAVTYGAYSKTYTAVAGSTGAFDFDIDLPQIGNHTVTVTVEDLAGNRASDTLNFERVMPTKPPPPATTSSWQDWLEGNWVYLVLLASIVTSLVIVVIIVVPSKRRRQARTRIEQSRAAARAEREEGMASEGEESGGEGPGGGEEAGSEAEAEAEASRSPPGDRPANEWEELEEPEETEEPEAGDGR